MQRENFPAALEVADHMQEAKRRLILGFWRTLEEKIRTDVARFPSWVLEIDKEQMLVSGDGEPVSVKPKDRRDSGYFFFALGEEAGKQGLYFGIRCSGGADADATALRATAGNLPEFSNLEKQIRENSSGVNWGAVWIAGRYISELSGGKPLNTNENLRRLSEGPSLADGAEVVFIDFLNTYAAPLESVNLALGKLGKCGPSS